jgi:hypothetical protein
MGRKRISILVSLVLCSVFLLVSSAFAQSTFTPNTQNILDRWTKALGGRDKIEQIKNVYQDGTTTEGGLQGSLKEWSTAAGQHRRLYERTGVDSTVTIYDGRRGWYRDWNGKVHNLEGADLQNEVAEAYQSSYSALIPARMSAKVEFLGTDETGKLYILKFSPLGGRTITYFIDKSTFLPVKSERLNEEGILLTTRFSDWHEVEGVKVPFSVRRSTGDGKYDTTITVKRAVFNLANTGNAFVQPPDCSFDMRLAQGNSALRIPFKRNNNFILLQGRINDSAPLWFILDTGASITVINKDRAAQLGLPLLGDLEIGTSGASTGFSVIKDVSLALPGAEVINQRAGAISLGIFEAGLGLRIGGVLGFDFISRFVMEIDFEAETINLHNPATYRYKGNGKIIPFTLEGGRPFIQASISVPGGRLLEGRFEIDSGDTKSIYLNTPFVREHNLATVSQKVAGSKGTSTNYINSLSVNGRLDKLVLGPFAVSDVPVGLSLGESGFVANPDYAGLIGNAILNRFRVIFDYSHKQLILEATSRLHEPFSATRSFGILLIAQGPELETLVIARVTKDSPAEQAGLRRGDIIMAIDETQSTALTLEQVQLFLNHEGRKYLLTVRRGAEILKLPVEIKLTTASQ